MTAHLDATIKTLRANLSPRYLKIDLLERYADGTQYADRPSFWDDDKPLLERAPCIIVPIFKNAAASFVDMVLGEGRGPKITSKPGEDSTVFDPRFGLSDAQSADLDRGIACIAKQTRFETALKRLLSAAQISKTGVAIAGVRNGKLFVDTTKAKWCTPTFCVERPTVVVSLEIRYPYVQTYVGEDKKPRERVLLYRRVIDTMTDTTYLPAKATDNGGDPDTWEPDTTKTVVHGFGFCPVHWYPFMREDCAAEDFDGEAIHELLLDEADALNRARSMRHRAALYCGDPQMAEYGVGEDENPAPAGQQASVLLIGPQDNPQRWRIGSASGARPGRKRGAGVINTYRNEKAHAEWLTLPPGALKPIEEDADDLHALIADALCWVPLDAKEVSGMGQLSGRALQWLHKKQTDRALSYRDDFGENCILPLIDLLIRIVLATPTERLRLPGVAKLKALLGRFDVTVETAPNAANDVTQAREWVSPELSLVWPPFFEATELDAKATGDNVRADLQAKIITKRTAVEKLAQFYDIDDVDAYLLALEEDEKEEAAERVGATPTDPNAPTSTPALPKAMQEDPIPQAAAAE